MRLGAYIMQPYRDAGEYIRMIQEKGYRAAYCPEYLRSCAQQSEIKELKCALKENDIVLAEVGTWVNPLSPKREEREAAQAYLIERLALAEELGACCCVNVLGSLSERFWYAPCGENFTEAFFEAAVEVYRKIIDAVDVKHTKMTFELMPYGLLDDTRGYLRFLELLDRPEQTAVHLDLVNMVHDPRTLFGHRALFKDAVEKLGPYTASVHVKDICLDPEALNTHLIEVQPGSGEIDLGYMLDLLSGIEHDVPVMLEHLPDDAAYDKAAAYMRSLAAKRNYHL